MPDEHVRSDAHLHVTGAAEFVDDARPPVGMLQAQVHGSPVAHGRLLSIDVDAARAVEGVVAVLTAADVPGQNSLGPIVQDETLLAQDLVRFAGQPLAVVVATTFEQARDGVGRVRATIDALPVVTDPREAYAQGSTFDAPRTLVIGDPDRAFGECDVIVEGTCEIGGQEHLYLETQRARAYPGEDGTIRVLSSTQSPHAVQRTVAAVLGLPYHAVEVDVLRLGGGFGGKEDQATHWAAMAALAAARLGRPVELVLSRGDDMRMTGKRHAYHSEFKLGLRKTGEIVALEMRHYQNAGAFTDLSPAVLERTLFHSTNAYRVPNARIFGVCCRTNLPPSTAFRGFGAPQAMFVMECALTRAAESLGMRREELQRKNLLRDRDRLPYGQVVRRPAARRTWDRAARVHDLGGLRREVEAFNAAHDVSKLGLAVMPVCFGIAFTKGFLNQAGALVHVYGDGSVGVSTGGVEMGQGHATKMRQIVARALGIGLARVRVEATNTTRVANMSPSAASVTTDLNGFAALAAIEQILGRLRAIVACRGSGVKPGDVSIRDERVYVRGRETDTDWAALVRAAYLERVDLSAHGFHATPGIHFDRAKEQGRPFAYYVYGTAIVQVRLDVLRGTFEIRRVRLVHDLGRPINPFVDLGQIEGGLAQGLGWMALEDLQFAEDGICRSATLSTYKIPDVYFMPDEVTIDLIEPSGAGAGPYGSKGVGEPPLMYGIGLFFAVRDAMRAARPGRQLAFHAPLTPERVLLQLNDGLPSEDTCGARGKPVVSAS